MSSGRDRHPAGWVLPQPCLPLVPNPSPVLLPDCWPFTPLSQLFLVTTGPWPRTDQTSTQHESLSTLTGGGAATENTGALPAPAPVLESRAGRGSPDSGGRRGLTTHALPPALTRDKFPAFSGLQLPPQQEVNASGGSEFIEDVCEAPCAQHAAYTHAGPQVHSRGPSWGTGLREVAWTCLWCGWGCARCLPHFIV